MLDERFDMPDDFTREAMFGDTFGIIWCPTEYDVEIRFTPEIAPYIIEREWQSFAAMEAAHMKAGADPEIQALRGESQKVFDSVRFQFHMVIA